MARPASGDEYHRSAARPQDHAMTASAPALNTDPAHFGSEGYCVFRGRVPRSLMAEASRALDALIASRPDVRPEHLTEPHKDHAFWLELCRHPGVVEAARQVLGPNLILIMTHLIVKPAGDGRKIAWHQDAPTWPQVVGTDICTAWLAIDRADVGNGCMRVIPRSHDGHRALTIEKDEPGNVFDFKVSVGPAQEAAAVPIELDPGDFSLHDAHALHGSEANPSPRRRAGFTMRYANADTVTVDVARHWTPVFTVAGDVDPTRGYHDIRPGRPLPALPLAVGDVARPTVY